MLWIWAAGVGEDAEYLQSSETLTQSESTAGWAGAGANAECSTQSAWSAASLLLKFAVTLYTIAPHLASHFCNLVGRWMNKWLHYFSAIYDRDLDYFSKILPNFWRTGSGDKDRAANLTHHRVYCSIPICQFEFVCQIAQCSVIYPSSFPWKVLTKIKHFWQFVYTFSSLNFWFENGSTYVNIKLG